MVELNHNSIIFPFKPSFICKPLYDSSIDQGVLYCTSGNGSVVMQLTIGLPCLLRIKSIYYIILDLAQTNDVEYFISLCMCGYVGMIEVCSRYVFISLCMCGYVGMIKVCSRYVFISLCMCGYVGMIEVGSR